MSLVLYIDNNQNDCSIAHKFRQGIVMQFIITLLGEQSDVNTFFAKTAMLNNL